MNSGLHFFWRSFSSDLASWRASIKVRPMDCTAQIIGLMQKNFCCIKGIRVYKYVIKPFVMHHCTTYWCLPQPWQQNPNWGSPNKKICECCENKSIHEIVSILMRTVALIWTVKSTYASKLERFVSVYVFTVKNISWLQSPIKMSFAFFKWFNTYTCSITAALLFFPPSSILWCCYFILLLSPLSVSAFSFPLLYLSSLLKAYNFICVCVCVWCQAKRAKKQTAVTLEWPMRKGINREKDVVVDGRQADVERHQRISGFAWLLVLIRPY